MTFTKALSVSALFAAVGVANAAITGVTWRQVDNTVGAPGSDAFAGAVWNAMNQYTFDLILLGDAGQRVNGINMGDANAPAATPYFIQTNGATFNHAFGGNVRSTAFEAAPGFNAIQYDTYVAMGDLAAANISFAGGVDLSTNGTSDQFMRATWFTTSETVLNAQGEMRIMRVTVGYAQGFDPFTQGGFLGTSGVGAGDASTIEIGLPGGALQVVTVGNAFIPAPGAMALAGLAGLAGLRRRR